MMIYRKKNSQVLKRIIAIFKYLRKYRGKKFWVATYKGHTPWGTGFIDVYYLLYVNSRGRRQFEEINSFETFECTGRETMVKPSIIAWVYGAPLPKKGLIEKSEDIK